MMQRIPLRRSAQKENAPLPVLLPLLYQRSQCLTLGAFPNRRSFDAVRASSTPTLHPAMVEAGCRA